MSWQQVARKDFEDSIRSWLFWTLVGVALLLMVIVAFGAGTGDTDGLGHRVVYMLFNSLGSQLVVPGLGLVFGYMAVVGERESGSLRVLFGLSYSRRDVLVGKLASRAAVILVGTLLSAAVVAGLILVLFDEFAVGTYLTFLVLTVLLALTFTGISVGLSAAVGTRTRAMGAAIGTYAGFMLLWRPLVAIVHYVVEGGLAEYSAPSWYLALVSLNPLAAYREALGQELGLYLYSLIGWPNIVENVSQQQTTAESALLLTNRAGGDPFFLSSWFAGLVLVAWFVLPVAYGYWRFERADLN